jgi:hypothetical protein
VNFKEQIEEDLDKILFNTEEFANTIIINDTKEIKAIFYSESEVENSYSTSEPYFLVKSEDAKDLQIDDKITFNNTTYYISEIIYTDIYTTKLFISINNRYYN